MLDRLVYILFFIFVGSGLFLLYQGLSGMGYLGTSPAPTFTSQHQTTQTPSSASSSPVETPVRRRKAFLQGPVSLEEVEAAGFVLQTVESEHIDEACDFFIEHLDKLETKGDQFNVGGFMRMAETLGQSLQKRPSFSFCAREVQTKSFKILTSLKAVDWKSEEGAGYLGAAIPALSGMGYFADLADFYDRILPVLRMKLPFYKEKGRIIEECLCDALKKMARSQDCEHLYPAFDSPQMQVYTLATRALYEEEYDRLEIYNARMVKYEEKGRWTGYERYLKSLYYLYVRKDPEKAAKRLSDALRLRRGLSLYDNLAIFDHYLKALKDSGQAEKFVAEVKARIAELEPTGRGSSYPGMYLWMQMQLAKRFGWSDVPNPQVLDNFKKYMSEDAFAAEYLRALQTLQKGQTYKAPFASPPLLEIEEAQQVKR